MAYIYVYDSNQWGSLSGFGYEETVEIRDIEDMVTKTLSFAGTQRYPVTLIIAGDGGVNYQSVGAGDSVDSTGNKSLQLDANGNLKGAAAIHLPKLNGHISRVRMVGVDDDNLKSTKLMLAVAAILRGVRITGNHSEIINYRATTQRRARRITRSAHLERGTLRQRLSELDGTKASQ